MKKFKESIKKIIASVIILSFISSCSTTNDVVSKGIFSKRKFNKGFYVNTNKKIKINNESANAEKKAEDVFLEKQVVLEIIPERIIASDNIIDQENSQNITPVLSVKTEAPILLQVKDRKAVKVENSIKNKITENQNKTFFKQARKQYLKQNKGGDERLILLVILCFLLPPLAVYLFEGSWTSRCTLNLILTLLCGLPGVIHALIVVLT